MRHLDRPPFHVLKSVIHLAFSSHLNLVYKRGYHKQRYTQQELCLVSFFFQTNSTRSSFLFHF